MNRRFMGYWLFSEDVPSGTPVTEPYSRLFVFCLWIFLFAISMTGNTEQSHAQSANDEYRVKAAFLFHFAQLVDWPTDSMGESGSPLVLCTIGDDPFHGDLESIVDGKLIGAHMLRVRHLKRVQEIHGCQMLFVGRDEAAHLASLIAEAQSASVLTVGEAENFLGQGGVINFTLDHGKLRFEINLNAAGRARLRISSRLLLLAKNVVGNSGGDQ